MNNTLSTFLLLALVLSCETKGDKVESRIRSEIRAKNLVLVTNLENLAGYTKSTTNTPFSIDYINNYNINELNQGTLRVKGDKLTIGGWAIDATNQSHLQKVYCRIGEELTELTYGIERSDVANVYQNQNYIYCGFYGEVKLPESKGQNVSLSLVMISSKPETLVYFESAPAISLDIK